MCPECLEPLIPRDTGPGLKCTSCGDVWKLQKKEKEAFLAIATAQPPPKRRTPDVKCHKCGNKFGIGIIRLKCDECGTRETWEQAAARLQCAWVIARGALLPDWSEDVNWDNRIKTSNFACPDCGEPLDSYLTCVACGTTWMVTMPEVKEETHA